MTHAPATIPERSNFVHFQTSTLDQTLTVALNHNTILALVDQLNKHWTAKIDFYHTFNVYICVCTINICNKMVVSDLDSWQIKS